MAKSKGSGSGGGGSSSSSRRTSTHKQPSKSTRLQVQSSHRMTTRGRASQFRIMDLPPELRNEIYAHALAEPNGIPLLSYRIPALLQVSSHIRKEAIGLFTGVNHLQITTRCNYCVKTSHFANKNHMYYYEAGILGPDRPVPSSMARRNWLILNNVVFTGLVVEVCCCCCAGGTRMATLKVAADGGELKTTAELYQEETFPKSAREELKVALGVVEKNVLNAVKEVSQQAKGIEKGLIGLEMKDMMKLVSKLKVPVGGGLDDLKVRG
ncbi:hypothetical protein B0A48_03167 [Cryoendolithus antarcticus]|uniref:F-box domain-containing protein n=1 Tax=Cryoendolithus antarcticus TaxID=1507870 RepID=A0A1V8TJ84_9PEZI|nr:hypothetical protein B0A48_03167 [Cryoendolithus antarcticus]